MGDYPASPTTLAHPALLRQLLGLMQGHRAGGGGGGGGGEAFDKRAPLAGQLAAQLIKL